MNRVTKIRKMGKSYTWLEVKTPMALMIQLKLSSIQGWLKLMLTLHLTQELGLLLELESVKLKV